MAHTTIELTIMAADGLKNVSFLRGKMDPFAVAFVDPYFRCSTRVLKKGGSDPVWNDCLRIPVDDRFLYEPNSALTIQVFNQSPINTSLVGATQLMLHELFRQLKGNNEGDILTLQLFRPSGRPYGVLRVFLKVTGDNLAAFSGPFEAEHNSLPEAPATGYPAMPMPYYVAPMVQYPSNKSNKVAYPYSASHLQPGYLPYPVPPSRRRNNFLYGLVSGAVAAVLLGAIF